MPVFFSLGSAILLGATSPSPTQLSTCEVAMAMENGAAAWLEAFNKRWAHEGYPPVEVTPAELDQAGSDLSYTFPASYRSAVLAVGLPRPTADLWDAIDEQSDLPHLGDFLTPTEIVESISGWTPSGYPNELVPFASDSGGNLLSFRRGDVRDAVYLWDHDFGTVEQIAPSFADLLEAYCSLPKAAAQDRPHP